MIMLRNPYEGIWEKHRSIDDMDMILESKLRYLLPHQSDPIVGSSGNTSALGITLVLSLIYPSYLAFSTLY